MNPPHSCVMRSLMQLSNLNLASKSSMKMYFFVGTPASLLLIQLLPPWTSCMPIQKEFTGGRWRHIELCVCSCDLVSEVFNETIRATVFMESLAWYGVTFVTDCLWGPNTQLFQDKKMHSTWRSTDDKCGAELHVSLWNWKISHQILKKSTWTLFFMALTYLPCN